MPHTPGKSLRRNFLKSAGTLALGNSLMGGRLSSSASARARAGGSPDAIGTSLPPLRITDVRVIVTCPDRNYVLVKILTSEPGLYGVGDATLNV